MHVSRAHHAKYARHVVMTIEPDVTNQSREGLVTSGSMVITTKMIGPGISGSIPSHSGNLVPYPRSQRPTSSTSQYIIIVITGHRTLDLVLSSL